MFGGMSEREDAGFSIQNLEGAGKVILSVHRDNFQEDRRETQVQEFWKTKLGL